MRYLGLSARAVAHVLLLAAALHGGCVAANTPPDITVPGAPSCLSIKSTWDGKTIPMSIKHRQATLFQEALHDTELDVELESWPKDLTLFIPTDKALLRGLGGFLRSRGIPEISLQEEDEAAIEGFLEQNAMLLRSLLLYHAVSGVHTTADFTSSSPLDLETLDSGRPLRIEGNSNHTVIANGITAHFVGEEIPLCKGVAHLIDHVLVPPGFDQEVVLGANATSKEGGNSTEANVTEASADGENIGEGVDDVAEDDPLRKRALLEQGENETVKFVTAEPWKGDCLSWVSPDPRGPKTFIAEVYPQISTFASYVRATTLNTDWQSGWDQNFTVFAPTNRAIDAFMDILGIADYPNGFFFNEDEKWIFFPYLMQAVANGHYPTSELTNGTVVKTNSVARPLTAITSDNSESITLEAFGNSANIVIADIEFCDGVTHIVDAVLSPRIPRVTAGSASLALEGFPPDTIGNRSKGESGRKLQQLVGFAPPLVAEGECLSWRIDYSDGVPISQVYPELSTFQMALYNELLDEEEAGKGLFRPGNTITVFAPTDKAVAGFLKGQAVPFTADEIVSNQTLVEVLWPTIEEGIVIGYYPTSSLSNGMVLQTLAADDERTDYGNLTIDILDDDVIVKAPGSVARVVQGRANIATCNGVLHIVDAMLLPSGVGWG